MKVHTLFFLSSLLFIFTVFAAEQSVITDAKVNLYNFLDFSGQQFYDKTGKLRDDIFNTWSQSQLKAWADIHGLEVPQTSKRDELLSFYRRHKYLLQQDIDEFVDYASKNAVPYLSKVPSEVEQQFRNAKDSFFELWDDSRLKAFLDAQGVTGYEKSTKDKLIALAKERKQKINQVWDSYDFEKWSVPKLQSWLKERGQVVSDEKDELVKQARNYLSRPFHEWSDTDLKEYLKTFGIRLDPNTPRDKALKLVRENQNLFKYGEFTDSPTKAQVKYNLKKLKAGVCSLASKMWSGTYSLYRKIFGYFYKQDL